jgi:putative addiction module component (TIGR02574 family)
MSTEKSALLAGALRLTVRERLSLAAELLDSVEGDDDPSWEAAWLAELDRRMKEAESDPSSMQPWGEVKRAILDDLGQR